MSQEAQLPTEEDLRRLSLRAAVAYAARAARRVQPLYAKAMKSPEHIKALDTAIRLGEDDAITATGNA